MTIKRGTHITARHIKSGRLLFYKVVVERETGLFRLMNFKSYYLMCGFKTKNPNDIVDYIEKGLKSEILKISM